MRNKKAPSPAISQYHFLPRKYGWDLLLDINRIETLENFVLDSTPHQLSFYEILFLEKSEGHFILDEHKVSLSSGTIIFTSPGQVRRCYAKQSVRARKTLVLRAPFRIFPTQFDLEEVKT